MTGRSFHADLATSLESDARRRLDTFYRETLFPFSSSIDILAKRDQWVGDVAVRLEVPSGTMRRAMTIEEKLRDRDYRALGAPAPDVLIEYLSNEERGTAGWVYTSSADFLSYVWKNPAAGYLSVFVAPMRTLRDWFVLRGLTSGFEDRRSSTSVGGDVYHTVNKVVPLAHAAFSAVLALSLLEEEVFL